MDWPEGRWVLLPVSDVDPQLLVIPLHDLDLTRVYAMRGPHKPIHVDCRSGEFRVADGRHRALRALLDCELVPARLLTLAHQP